MIPLFSARHLADPVELLANGAIARCSCGKLVERLLRPSSQGRDPLREGDYRWRHVR